MALPDLPQEILIEIFSILPSKSIGKCRCLSKSWSQYLSTREFIKLHTSRRSGQQKSLILISKKPKSILLINPPIHKNSPSKNIGFPIVEKKWKIIGSCHGLVLLVDGSCRNTMFLVNPITLKQIDIPDCKEYCGGTNYLVMYGFGYDRSSDDYKIVKLSLHKKNYYRDNKFETEQFYTIACIYSLKRGLWKEVGRSPYDYLVGYDLSCSTIACVNGAMHWFGTSRDSDRHCLIVSLDLANEIFYEIPIPANLDLSKLFVRNLYNVGECLWIDCFSYSCKASAWIMRKYGFEDSWTNFIPKGRKPMYFTENDEVVVAAWRSCFVAYDLEDGKLNYYQLIDDDKFYDVSTFVESLVSPVSIAG